jgi:hypothetical protein
MHNDDWQQDLPRNWWTIDDEGDLVRLPPGWKLPPVREPQQIGQPLTPEPDFTHSDRAFLRALHIKVED